MHWFMYVSVLKFYDREFVLADAKQIFSRVLYIV